jgi:hypothetical protein
LIEPSALRAAKAYPFEKLMAQSKRGAIQRVTAKMYPLTKAISIFIQAIAPLLPLKPMAQLHRGVT